MHAMVVSGQLPAQVTTVVLCPAACAARCRQGDPGDTFLLTSYDDPLFKASVFLKTRRLMAHSHGIADLGALGIMQAT